MLERWRKSTRSTSTGGNCLEAAATGRTVAMRDSKNPDGPTLAVSRGAWATFTRTLKR